MEQNKNEQKEIQTGEELETKPPRYFSIGIGINGHPMQSNIVADGPFTDWDLLQVAWKIELAVFDTMKEKGLSKEEILSHIMNINYYRRDALARSLDVLFQDKDITDAMMEVNLIKDYDECLKDGGKEIIEKCNEKRKERKEQELENSQPKIIMPTKRKKREK